MYWLATLLLLLANEVQSQTPQLPQATAKNYEIERLPHKTIFKLEGKIYSDLMYGHLSVPLDVNPLIERRDLLEDFNEELSEIPTDDDSWPKTRRQHLDWIKDWTDRKVTGTLVYLDSSIEMFNHTVDSQRKKRQATFIAAGVGALVTAVVNKFQRDTLLDVVQKKQTVIQAQVQSNLVGMNQNRVDIERLNSTMGNVVKALGKMILTDRLHSTAEIMFESAFAINDVLDETRRLLEAIERVRSGYFSTDLATPEALAEAVDALKKDALKTGRVIAIENLLDLSLLPASYVYDPDTKIFYAICHVPFSNRGNVMDLYRFLDTPMIFANHSQVFAQIGYLEQPFIAVSKDTSHYVTLSLADLMDCNKMEHSYYCPNKATYKRQRPSCLLSLFDNNVADVQRRCPLSVANEMSTAIRVEAHLYILVETRRQELTIKCPNGEIHSEWIEGVYQLTLASGCSAYTDHLSISHPLYEPRVEVPGLVLNAPINPEAWFAPEIEQEHYLEAAKELLSKVGEKVPISSVHQLSLFKQRMSEIRPDMTWSRFLLSFTPGSFSSTIMFAGVSMLVLFIFYRVVVYACYRRVKVRHRLLGDDDLELRIAGPANADEAASAEDPRAPLDAQPPQAKHVTKIVYERRDYFQRLCGYFGK